MEKVYMISDDDGNYYTVTNWDGLFDVTTEKELEDLYVICKYHHSIEESMIELQDAGMIEKINEGEEPIEYLANSLDKMSEKIGFSRIKELDCEVYDFLAKRIDERNDNVGPENFIHLN